MIMSISLARNTEIAGNMNSIKSALTSSQAIIRNQSRISL